MESELLDWDTEKSRLPRSPAEVVRPDSVDRRHNWCVVHIGEGLNDVGGAFHARSGRQRALECSFGVLHRVVDLLSNRSSDQRTEILPPRFLGPLLMVPEEGDSAKKHQGEDLSWEKTGSRMDSRSSLRSSAVIPLGPPPGPRPAHLKLHRNL